MRILTFFLLFLPLLAQAQAQEPIPPTRAEPTAVIRGPEDIAIGRTVVLDASGSRDLGEKTSYRWFLGESSVPISRTVEAVFTPEQPGPVRIRLVITTEIDGEKSELSAEHAMTVYERKMVLITDPSVPEESLLSYAKQAQENDIFLRILRPVETSIPLGAEEALTTIIGEDPTILAGAETIIVRTETIAGLQALMRALEGNQERLEEIQEQTIVLISERSVNLLSRTARGPFAALTPERIIVTHEAALPYLLQSESISAFIGELEQHNVPATIVDAGSIVVRPWNLLATFLNFMLTHGVSSQIIVLLLALPIIATILAFLKQVIGITTFGLYTPSILALSFLSLGWTVGLVFLFFILTTGYLTRAFMRRFRLLYIPKVALILTVVSITLLLLLGLGALYGITFPRDTIFILLIMSTLSESFLTVKAEQGWRGAIIGILETVLASLLCVFIVQWTLLQSLLLAYPELIFLTLVFNIVLGRWTGLRLVEYFRFREVFRHLQEE